MKLPALPVCHLSCNAGNIKQMTVMGEVLTEGLSDRGSTPLRSTKKEKHPRMRVHFSSHS